MNQTTDRIEIQVTEEALPASEAILAAMKSPLPAMTPELAAKVLALEFDSFTRAILEFLFDAPRTIEPVVANVAIGLLGEQDEKGMPTNLVPALVAFSTTDPGVPVLYGPTPKLGFALMLKLTAGEITIPDYVACLGTFPAKIENFADFYGPDGNMREKPECQCENCVAKRKLLEDGSQG